MAKFVAKSFKIKDRLTSKKHKNWLNMEKRTFNFKESNGEV
jgi:hypothetical protein